MRGEQTLSESLPLLSSLLRSADWLASRTVQSQTGLGRRVAGGSARHRLDSPHYLVDPRPRSARTCTRLFSRASRRLSLSLLSQSPCLRWRWLQHAMRTRCTQHAPPHDVTSCLVSLLVTDSLIALHCITLLTHSVTRLDAVVIALPSVNAGTCIAFLTLFVSA